MPFRTRTFLNCHKLFLNTVSISLRAEIEWLPFSILITHVLCCQVLGRVATAFGLNVFLPATRAPLHGLNKHESLAHSSNTS